MSAEQLQRHFVSGLPDHLTWKTDVWQDYAAPIVVGDAQGRHALLGEYGMVPKRHIAPGVKRYSTMNARAETVATLRSYAQAWHDGQLCLVPMMAFYEPNYESGKAERWRIGMADQAPFAVAGLYRSWREADGAVSYSFTQITINADTHPLMRRFQKPEDEKRSLVIVPPGSYDDWLQCRSAQQAREFLKNCPAELMQANPAPKVMPVSPNHELF